jgi:preprotein translocase subunit SecA
MFTELMNNIWDEFARYIFNVEVQVEPEQQQAQQQPAQRWAPGANTSSTGRRLDYSGGHAEQGREAIAAAAGAAVAPAGASEPGAPPAGMAQAAELAAGELAASVPVVETRRLDDNEKLGRNDPCWCGSGKKFKKCHGATP